MNIGVVGVGNMGGAMALRLLSLGAQVSVHDVNPDCLPPLAAAGARVLDSAAAVAAASSVVIVAVVDAKQTDEVLFGAHGVVRATPRPSTVLLCPTIAPEATEGFAKQLAQAGIGAIDAPMSGGPLRARDGSMSLMVACSDALFEAHQGLLAMLSSQVHRISNRVGDGARTKLVNNLLATINLAGAAEAFALAQAMGLDVARTLAVVEQSSGQSWIGSERMHRALAGDTVARAHMRLLRKDSALALAMAQQAGLAPPALGAEAAALFARACEAGLDDQDDARLFAYLSNPSSSA